MESLAASLTRVRERIDRACTRSHRDPASIRLIAVTKRFPPAAITAAYDLGIRDFGENYVQEFDGKRGSLNDLPGSTFHLIGHLQSNKARRAAELFQVVQTVDSARLALRLNESAANLKVMLEVNVSGEAAKSGAAPGDLPALVDSVRSCPNLDLLGLMAIPEWSEDAERSRASFARLRELAGFHALRELSMGMSNDFEFAIEEGATMIRVGTALFGKRPKP